MLAAQWTSATVALAFRLALPVMGFLLLLDLALALMARTQPQLQLINLALPVKTGAALLLLAWQTPALPALLGRAASESLHILESFGSHP
jgi:flagellar biosynthesis protein FliR